MRPACRCRVQEIELAQQDAGRIPRTVECELTEDLVDSCVPGDVVRAVACLSLSCNPQAVQLVFVLEEVFHNFHLLLCVFCARRVATHFCVVHLPSRWSCLAL